MSSLASFDVEAAVVAYIAPELDGPVSVEAPNPRPATFTRVLRTGGTRIDLFRDRAQITVECWRPTTVEAAAAAGQARALIYGMQNTFQAGVWISQVRDVAGPANLPDNVSRAPRYTFTVMVFVRNTSP